MEIVSREQWGAVEPRGVTKTVAHEMFLHHTVGSRSDPYSYMRAMQDWHMNGRDPRMWDIAYNHVVDFKSMTVFEGRGFGVRPAAQKSHNDNTWAVAVMGNYRAGQSVATQDEIDLVLELINHGRLHGFLPVNGPVRGHYEVQTKDCPGANLKVWLPYLNGEEKEKEEDVTELIKAIQMALNAGGFQGANGKPLTVDGILGTNTQHALNAQATAAQKGNHAFTDVVSVTEVHEIARGIVAGTTLTP